MPSKKTRANTTSYLDDYEFDEAEEDSDPEGDNSSVSNVIACGNKLPQRGISDSTKMFLLNRIEDVGGLSAIANTNRLLGKICDGNPDELGAAGTELRKRVQNTYDHWKRSKNFYSITRPLIVADYENQQRSNSKKRLSLQSPSVTPKPKQTPPVKRQSRTPKSSKNSIQQQQVHSESSKLEPRNLTNELENAFSSLHLSGEFIFLLSASHIVYLVTHSMFHFNSLIQQKPLLLQ